MRYNEDDLRKCHNGKENNNGAIAVVTLSYDIATNAVASFDVYPNSPFEATACEIEIGDDLADVVACLLQNGFELVSNVAATVATTTGAALTAIALGHYTFIKM